MNNLDYSHNKTGSYEPAVYFCRGAYFWETTATWLPLYVAFCSWSVTKRTAANARKAITIPLIIGGIRYVVSGGDQGAVTSAKNTILYAIIGIVIAFLAFAAVRFVTDQLQKATYNGSHVAVVTQK